MAKQTNERARGANNIAKRSMNIFATGVAIILGLVVALAVPAGAQSYEGADPEAGVFDVPAGIGSNGGTVAFTATGLAPDAAVTIVVLGPNGAPIADTSSDLTVQVQADASGRATASIPIPAGLPDGNYSINVTSTKADGSAFASQTNFQAGDSTPDDEGDEGDDDEGDDGDDGGSSDAPALALTGSSSRTLGGAAALLIVLGGGLLMVNRKKND